MSGHADGRRLSRVEPSENARTLATRTPDPDKLARRRSISAAGRRLGRVEPSENPGRCNP
ncbi:8131_t:CDS:2 [Ambispora gerdemannii]|uniref:8131_t:CDS:1 n=1 Tax=Ambispora gerdemannii TaxID=144530 RepID=A0A9N9F8K5_9GLOM|nr:8131_t:CDS:2 [Ambispora gerdemannii]